MFLKKPFEIFDVAITSWMARTSVTYLRYTLALIFIWFGSLKFFPGLSPTIGLIERATEMLTLGNLPAWVAIYALATAECLIGLGLFFNKMMRCTLLFLFLQMLATSTPIFLIPDVVFIQIPFVLTLEGHHLVKNLIVIGAGFVIGATVRGGRLVAEPSGLCQKVA